MDKSKKTYPKSILIVPVQNIFTILDDFGETVLTHPDILIKIVTEESFRIIKEADYDGTRCEFLEDRG